MTYTQVINGITVTSNVPFDQAIPQGSLVTLDLHFNSPVSYLATLGYDLLTILNQATFQAQLVAAGWNGAITNYSVYSIDSYTQRIAFIVPVTAAGVLQGQPFIAPIIFLYVGLAIAGIIVAASLGAFLINVGGQVAGAIGAATPYVLVALGIVAAVGTTAFIYDFVKGGHPFRKRVYREAGHTAKGIAKGAARLSERAVVGTARGGYRIASRRRGSGGERDSGDEEREERRSGGGIY